MITLAIITAGVLPVPCVKGGAVETGIQQLIDMNEKYKKAKLIIFSISDDEAICVSKNYTNTEFVFIDEPNYEKILIVIRKAINKVCSILGLKFRIVIRGRYIKKIKKYLKEKQADAILVKNTESYVEILEKCNIPLFFQLHNDFLNENTYRANHIVDSCKGIIANSNYIATRIMTINNMKNRKVFINYNCNDNEKFKAENINHIILNEFKRKYEIKDESVKIIFVGRLTPQKGIKELIIALGLLPSDINWQLLVVGSKWFSSKSHSMYEKELENLAEKYKDKIVFLGYLNHNEVPLAYNCSNIAVVPSIWDEPAGRVVLEAEAAGLPLIVSDAGGISEYTNEQCAIIIKRGDDFVYCMKEALLRLINNREECESRGKEGEKIANKFTMERYYNEIIDYIEENL